MFAMKRTFWAGLAAMAWFGALPVSSPADVVPTPFASWEGPTGYVLTGASLAMDTDGDSAANQMLPLVNFAVTPDDVPSSARLLNAYLYWGGTQSQGGIPDPSVELTIPGGAMLTIDADRSYWSDGGSMSYDMFLSRAEITDRLPLSGADLVGGYAVGGYSGLLGNRPIANASTALLLVFADSTAPNRWIVAHDGLLTMERSNHTIAVTDFDASTASPATLAWYTLEGDLGGTPREEERVTVIGTPGGAGMVVTDGVNPSNNPMNRTINTVAPPQEDMIGVDIDRFDISTAISQHDTALDIRYSANSDKWWLALSVVEVGLASGCAACDLNVDGMIDASDLAIWTPYFGSASTTVPPVGDFNGDGRVGLRDLAHLRAHLGEGVLQSTAASAAPAVPEPSTCALVAMAILASRICPKRKAPKTKRPKNKRLR